MTAESECMLRKRIVAGAPHLRQNDNRAITIEVASDTYHPYRVNDAAYKSLIKLLVDICKRNGLNKVLGSETRTRASITTRKTASAF